MKKVIDGKIVDTEDVISSIEDLEIEVPAIEIVDELFPEPVLAEKSTEPTVFSAYIAGSKRVVSQEEFDKYVKLQEEMNRLLGDKAPEEMPRGHKYWEVKTRFVRFIATLKVG